MVLDPRWLAQVMATVVTANAAQSWQLDHSNLCSLWPAHSYSPELRSTLLHLLQQFEVVYGALDEDGQTRDFSVVPGMLPELAVALEVDNYRTAMIKQRFTAIALGSSTALAYAVCVSVKLNHVPLHFFPRLHARIQAIVTPDYNGLWRRGGFFSTRDETGGDIHALVWMPDHMSRPGTIEVTRVHAGGGVTS